MKWLDSITNSLNINLSNLCETVEDRGYWVLQSMRLQRVRQDIAKGLTEQQIILKKKYYGSILFNFD